MSTETTWVGVYWDRAVLDRARSAYIADLASDPDCPVSFEGWLTRALELHARRTSAERVELAELSIDPDPRRKVSKGYRLAQTMVEEMETAIVADLQQQGRAVSRTGFAHEAVLAAAVEARRRFGRSLPPPPARLPNRPVRPASVRS